MPDQKIISIPIQKIMPNPRQPRRSFREGSIQEIADSLTAVGQLTPLKVCPLTREEMAQNAPFEVMVLGGHRRRAGALLAGLEALNCIVLDIAPGERGFYALMDNNLDDMDWWDWDVAIYDQFQLPPKLTQEDFAKRIGKSQTKVSKAVTIMKLLTPTAREIIDQNLGKTTSNGSGSGQPKKSEKTLIFDYSRRITKNKGFLITESILLSLADLGDPQKVEKALKVVMDDYLGEPEAKKLVEWEGMGYPLEDFTPQKYEQKAQALNQDPSVPGQAQLKPRAAKASAPRPPAGERAQSPIRGAQPNRVPVSQPTLAAKPTLVPAPNTHPGLTGLLTTLAGWFRQSAAQSLEKSVHQALQHALNRAVKAALWFLVLGAVGMVFLRGSLTRNGWPPRIELPPLGHQPRAAETTGTQTGPSPSAGPISPASAKEETLADILKPMAGFPPEPAGLTRTQKEARLALDFADHFYGADYRDFIPLIEYFKKTVDGAAYKSFMDHHYPLEKMRRMDEGKWYMSFKPTGPVKLLDSDDFSDWFLVKGVATTRAEGEGGSRLVSQKPVAARIIFIHKPGLENKVAGFNEMTPDGAQMLPDSGTEAEASSPAQGANSPSELAQPNQGSQLGASTQEAHSPSELAQPNQGSQLGASAQGANSPSASSQGDLITNAADALGDAAGVAAKKLGL